MPSSPSDEYPVEARDIRLRRMVEAFDPGVPLPQASTPPSSWYRDPSFYDLEFERVFLRGWQAVGNSETSKNPLFRSALRVFLGANLHRIGVFEPTSSAKL